MLRKAGVILTLDESEQTQKSARALVRPFCTAETRVKPFSNSACCSDLSSTDLNILVVLGHTGNHTYGDLSPQNFAREFAKRIGKNKDQVEHLYLIGCEVGLPQANGQSMAQEIADELQKLGFTKLQVHAVAKPEDKAGEAMYVEVKYDGGMANVHGYLDAYLMPAADAKALDKAKGKELDYKYKTADRRFLPCAHPVVALGRAVNTFVAGESPQQRKARIDADLYTQSVLLLQQHVAYENGKRNTDVVRKLEELLSILRRSPSSECSVRLKENKTAFSKNTRKLVGALSKGNLEAARAMVEKESPEAAAVKPTIVQRPVTVKSDLQVKTSSAAMMSSMGSTPQVPALTQPRVALSEIKENADIDARIKVLKTQIGAIKPPCLFPFFAWFEIETKNKKIAALTQIKNASGAAREIAIQDALDDSRVMRSAKTSNTKNLLLGLKRSNNR